MLLIYDIPNNTFESSDEDSSDEEEEEEGDDEVRLRYKELFVIKVYIDGLVQDCNISSALTMEILQSCTKPSILTSVFPGW